MNNSDNAPKGCPGGPHGTRGGIHPIRDRISNLELLKSQLQGISEQTTERRCRDQNCGGDIQAQELTCRQAGGRNVVLRLRLAAPGITASTRTNRTRRLDLDAYFDRIQRRGPIPPSRASSRSFCAACASTGPSSTGRQRRLLHGAHKETPGSRDTARSPCGDTGGGKIARC